MNQLAHLIRIKRLKTGLSQSEFAVRSKVLQSVVSRIESGKTKRPRLQTLACLGTACDLPAEELIHIVGKRKAEGNLLFSDEFFQAMPIDNPIEGRAVYFALRIRVAFLSRLLLWFSAYFHFFVNASLDLSEARVTIRLPMSFQSPEMLAYLAKTMRAEWGNVLLKKYGD